MVFGNLFKLALPKQVNTAVTDMEKMAGAALYDHRAKGTQKTFVTREFVALAIQIKVEGRQYFFTAMPYCPCIWRAVILIHKVINRRFTGLFAGLGCRHPIRYTQSNAFGF